MISGLEIEKRLEELKEKKCKKRCYPTRKLAKKMLEFLKLKNKYTKNLTKELSTIYKCQYCNQWHLTSVNKITSRNYTRHLRNKH